MDIENQKKQAALAYKTLCQMLDEKDWKYDKDEENFSISCSVSGEDLPMKIRIKVDPARMLITLLSDIPFLIPEGKRDALAVAVSCANYTMIDGSFDYDYVHGAIVFRMTATFRECLIGKGLFEYMLFCSCSTIDDYNDKFLMVAKTNMTNEEIVKFID